MSTYCSCIRTIQFCLLCLPAVSVLFCTHIVIVHGLSAKSACNTPGSCSLHVWQALSESPISTAGLSIEDAAQLLHSVAQPLLAALNSPSEQTQAPDSVNGSLQSPKTASSVRMEQVSAGALDDLPLADTADGNAKAHYNGNESELQIQVGVIFSICTVIFVTNHTPLHRDFLICCV